LNDGRPGNTRVSYDEDEHWLRVQRGSITILCNLGESAHSFPFAAKGQVLLASDRNASVERSKLILPSDSVAIVRTESESRKTEEAELPKE
jgi:maltooligosyltrehalose trehalohydrolase